MMLMMTDEIWTSFAYLNHSHPREEEMKINNKKEIGEDSGRHLNTKCRAMCGRFSSLIAPLQSVYVFN